ncbi:MAG: hypothetical protein JNG88_05325 [Phycisphaerales bacterium]|nr:hypothetical protein [Phycisphaerales bacterium]
MFAADSIDRKPRRNQKSRVLATFAMAALFAWSNAAAQNSVNQGGNLFDANPRVGGNRSNFDIRATSPLTVGNLGATGNLRFGQSVRSFSPITDPTAFSGPLGSAALSSFRRDSFGAGDLTRFSGGAQSYYDPARTAPTASFLNRTGSMPLGARSTVSQSPSTVGVPGVPGWANPLDKRLDTSVDFTPRNTYRTTTSNLFGTRAPLLPSPSDQIRDGLARSGVIDTTSTNPRNAYRPATAGAPADSSIIGAKPAVGSPMDVILRGQNVNMTPAGNPQADALTTPVDVTAGGLPGVKPPTRSHTAPQPPADAGGPARPRITDASILPKFDTFNDMRLALALRRDPTADWFEDMKRAAAEDPALQLQFQEFADVRAADFLNQMLSTPLATFVGKGASEVNNELLRAEAFMSMGEYYQAASRYDAAAALDGANPLPLIGKAHALIAAGDYLPAAVVLLRGLELFPDAALFSINLETLMGGVETVDIRRADILNRLKDGEDARLRFLLGYLEYHSGNRESGLANLDRAAARSIGNSILVRYADMLRRAHSVDPAAGRPGQGAESDPTAPKDGKIPGFVAPPPIEPESAEDQSEKSPR